MEALLKDSNAEKTHEAVLNETNGIIDFQRNKNVRLMCDFNKLKQEMVEAGKKKFEDLSNINAELEGEINDLKEKGEFNECAYAGLKMKYSKLEEIVTEKSATISKLMVKNNKLEDEKRKVEILLSFRA